MNRAIWRMVAGGLAVLLGASMLVSLQPARGASAEPLIPTVDCFTPSAIFNTGHNTATGGNFPNGTQDVSWEISQQFTTTQSTWPAVVQFPSTATWTSATVNRNGAWIPSPFVDANWISGVTTSHSGVSELFYYRYRFEMSPEVNAAHFSLAMDIYADNTVHEVWVNGVKQSTANPGEFPSSPSLFFGLGFRPGGQSTPTLDTGWHAGLNEIIIQLGSAQTHQGFLARVTSQAECGPNAVDDTRPLVAPGGSITPFDPLLNDIAGTSPLAPAALTLDQSTAIGGTFTVSGGLVSFTASPSFTGTGSIQYSISDTVGQSDTATIYVPVAATTGVRLDKRATPTTVDAAGSIVTYEFEVTNTGNVPLADVAVSETAFSGAGPVPVISCPADVLAAGASLTCTASYSVEQADMNAGLITNTAEVSGVPSVGDPVSASDTAVVSADASPLFVVAKTASLTTASPGDTVTYTVTVTNTGNQDFTSGSPAAFTDDLSAVLDDATYNGDATNGATVSGSTLSWSGALAVGASKAVTYSVTVNALASGDRVMNNAAVPGVSGTCAAIAACVVSTPVRSFSVVKSASASVVNPGDTVTYDVTVTNTGAVAYISSDPASFSDDLTAVLDDASYNGDATNGAAVSGDTLSWSGALAVGASVTVSYSVTVNAGDGLGDGVLTNAVVPAGPSGGCPVAGDCVTTTGVAAFTVAKSSAASVVNPGDVVTYTVEVTNIGGVDFTVANPALLTDDLSGVLDDAVYNDDASLGGEYAEPFISWALSVDAGDTVTVTYSVTVSAPGSGDGRMVNAVVPDDETGTCVPEEDCVTDTPVRSFAVVKSVDSGVATPGQVLRYEIVVTNTGQADYTLASPAAFVDDLSYVLGEGSFRNDATAGAVFVAPELIWRDGLAVGESVTITYSVQLNAAVRPNVDVVNTVFTPAGGSCPVPVSQTLTRGAFSASSLTTASTVHMPEGCVTITEVSALALTGSSSVTVPLVASGVLALMVGLGLLLIRRRHDAAP